MHARATAQDRARTTNRTHTRGRARKRAHACAHAHASVREVLPSVCLGRTRWIAILTPDTCMCSWLEKIVEFRSKSFVLGFYSDKFVVYNLTDQVLSLP